MLGSGCLPHSAASPLQPAASEGHVEISRTTAPVVRWEVGGERWGSAGQGRVVQHYLEAHCLGEVGSPGHK